MSLRHALLGLLARQPASGYDLMKLFETSLGNAWSATQSQLYTELTRLADAGLITAAAAGSRGRKEYTLAADGRAELLRWLTETDPPLAVRSETLLRIFLMGNLTGEQRIGYLDKLSAAYSREREDLERVREETDWGDGDLSVYGRLVLEFGLRYNAMRRDWVTWAAGQLP